MTGRFYFTVLHRNINNHYDKIFSKPTISYVICESGKPTCFSLILKEEVKKVSDFCGK